MDEKLVIEILKYKRGEISIQLLCRAGSDYVPVHTSLPEV